VAKWLGDSGFVSDKSTNNVCGSVGKDFVNHACGHEFESRLK